MGEVDQPEDMFRQLRAAFKVSLSDFDASSSTFRIVRSIPSNSASNSPSNCATVYVLDSSFNPPSKAHALLVENAVHRDRRNGAARILLLLATTNADKAMKPAAFNDRVAMMTLLAQSLYDATHQTPVDVGVTKKPFFADKAKSIDDGGTYGDAEQVHLVGFDTITRIFDSKYYPADQKLRVLDPFLTRHRLRVNYRLSDKYGDRHDQDKYLEGIADGSREDEGMKSEWRERIEMVNDAEDGMGISSTQARNVVAEGKAHQAVEFVDDAICKYMKEMNLYRDSNTTV